MILLPLCLVTGFSFKGGNPSLLVDALGEGLKRPACFLVDEDSKLGAFETKYDDIDLLLYRLRSYTSLDSKGKKVLSMAPYAWPNAALLPRGTYLGALAKNDESLTPWPAKAEPDGTVTIRGGGKYFLLKDIGTDLWGKPVTISKFYEGMKIAVYGDHASPKELLDLIAVTIGANLKESGKGWSLTPNAKEYRSRLRALLTLRRNAAVAQNDRPMEIANQDLALATLEVLSDKQIDEALEGEGHFYLPVAPGGGLASQVMHRFQVYSARNDTKFTVEEGEITPAQLVGRIDFDRPIRVVFAPLTGQAWTNGYIRGTKAGGIEF